MGWASAGDIFDPVCELIIQSVQKKAIPADRASEVLRNLIARLQDQDWDTEGESLEQFAEHPFVVAAFAAQGVELDEDDGEPLIPPMPLDELERICVESRKDVSTAGGAQ